MWGHRLVCAWPQASVGQQECRHARAGKHRHHAAAPQDPRRNVAACLGVLAFCAGAGVHTAAPGGGLGAGRK